MDNKYFLIHNGHISNFETLQEEHEKEGFNYKTATPCKKSYYGKDTEDYVTDSEALGIELAKFIEGKTKKIGCTGLYAFMLLQMTRNNEPIAIYYGRNGNPIKFYQNEKLMLMASEAKGLILPIDKLYRYDLGTDKYDCIDMREEADDFYKNVTRITPNQEDYSYEQEELGFNVGKIAKDLEFPVPENYFWRDFISEYSTMDENTRGLVEERDTLVADLEELNNELLDNIDMTDKNSIEYGHEIIKEARKKFNDAKELDNEIRKVVDNNNAYLM